MKLNKLETSDDMLFFPFFFFLPTSLLSNNSCHSLKHIFTKSGQTFSWVPSLRHITNEKQI